MNIRITRLSMTNFKCFREKELCLDEDIITIRGRNGAGKTTIADAILFCLFGKNTEGQSDLELFKTRADGKVIPNLDHSVEITIHASAPAAVPEASASGKELTLRRSIKEVWVKKRGSDESVFKNNTVEYFVNGESYTKADYEKYISTLVDERIFRAITNPTYFPSLKWQDQRNFLTAMVGTIEPECFADTDELKALVDYFDQHDDDIVSYLKHLKYKIKQVKDKLDRIPVRLEEQNKALPERLDWDALSSQQAELSAQLKDLDSKITTIQQGNGAEIKRAEIRASIENLRKKINDIEDKVRDTIYKETNEHRQRISDLSIKFNEALNNQKLMEQTIEADKRLIERAKEIDYERELEILRMEWPTEKFEIDESKGFCPACGQPLPQDQWQEKIEQMRSAFNQRKELKKRELNERAARVKKQQAEAAEELAKLEQKLADDTQTLATIKENVNTIFAQKAKEEKKTLPTFDDFLPCDEEYQAAIRERSNLESEHDAVTDSADDREQLTSLEQQRSQYAELLAQLQQQLATRAQYDRIRALIDGINEEQKDLVRQLSELEKKEDVARQYQFRQNQLLESRINQHFRIVQWRLFRTVNNGGDSFEEPFCECYVDGIPYHSGLNQAMRLNAGLDICEALCRFYRVSAPIVIDNAESTLNIYQTTGQQIRLQVYDSDLNLI